MEVQEPTVAAEPPGGTGVITRRRAAWWAAASVALVAAGIAVYAVFAPDLDMLAVELDGARPLPLPEEAAVAAAVRWDFLLIAGYGAGLTLAATLATRVFRTDGARSLARAGRLLALVAVAADLLEDVLLLIAVDALPGTSAPAESVAGLLLDVVAAAAVLKFICLLPAVVVAVTAVVVTCTRLVAHRKSRLKHRPTVTVEPPDPLEGDPSSRPAHPESLSASGHGSRWRRGYRVPGVDVTQQRGPVLGFCLSGGGIRSGSVALGALQALRGELRKARYLVSVSGGGYTAGALQLALTDAPRPVGETFPPAEVLRDPDSAYMPGSAEEDRFRRHARYLADSPAQLVVALGVVARVLVLSLFVLFAPAVVLGALFGEFYRVLPLAPLRASDSAAQLDTPIVPTGTWYLLGFLAVVATVAYLVSLYRTAYTHSTGAGSHRVARAATAVAVLVAVVGAGIPWLIYGAGWLLAQASDTGVRVGGPVLGVVLTYVVTLASFLRRKKVFDSGGGLFRRKGGAVGAVPGGALQLIMVAVVLILLAAGWLVLAGGAASVATGPDRPTVLGTAGIVLLLLLFLGGALDQTALSLHPFYRRRLAGAFAARRIRRADDGHVVAEGYRFEEGTPLPDYGARVDGFPHVVFAAAANLSGEQRAPFKATSFTMTADWLGGPDVGYVRTDELRAAVKPPFWRDLTVQAAVAISGAAFASATGRATRWYTTLLAVTGLRLGTWLPNPAFVERLNEATAQDDWTRPGLPGLRRLSYLLREVLGSHRYTDRLLQVTDGGHYENLGLVEALRRRCTEIYCIDASGDTPPTAGTLEQAITLAHAELGVRIFFDASAWDLVPGSAEELEPEGPLAGLNKRLSQNAVVVGRICYPIESGLPWGERHGVLVVAKALLTPGMSYDVLSYASRHEVFPHDTTGDQFFDDEKFTAYAALGRQIGQDAGALMTSARAAYLAQTPCPLGDRCPSSNASPAVQEPAA